jgi:hypothetical protein
MSASVLAEEFANRADPVNPALTSNTKWEPVDKLLAEALGRDDTDVYTATVSKAGNLSVRTAQSKTAGASVIVVMWTGEKQKSPHDFDRTVAAIRQHLSDRDLVLVARRASGVSGWEIVASLSATGGMPTAIAKAWPSAIALSY